MLAQVVRVIDQPAACRRHAAEILVNLGFGHVFLPLQARKGWADPFRSTKEVKVAEMAETTQRDEVLRPTDVQRDYRIKVKTLLKHRDEIPHFSVGSRIFFRAQCHRGVDCRPGGQGIGGGVRRDE